MSKAEALLPLETAEVRKHCSSMSKSTMAPYEVDTTEEGPPFGTGFAVSLACLASIPLWWAIVWVTLSMLP